MEGLQIFNLGSSNILKCLFLITILMKKRSFKIIINYYIIWIYNKMINIWKSHMYLNLSWKILAYISQTQDLNELSSIYVVNIFKVYLFLKFNFYIKFRSFNEEVRKLHRSPRTRVLNVLAPSNINLNFVYKREYLLLDH